MEANVVLISFAHRLLQMTVTIAKEIELKDAFENMGACL